MEDYHQTALGFDLEVGIRHFELNAEFMINEWDVPNITDDIGSPKAVETKGFYVEGRYALKPGLYAVRYLS